MPKTEVKSKYGKPLTLAWGGDLDTYETGGDLFVSRDGRSGEYVDGPALRDALLEAFPLEGEAKPEFHDVVPGMVLRSKFGYVFTVLPGDGYYDNTHGVAHTSGGRNWGLGFNDVVFDPRGAKALPNPLGIRVGDRVERTQHGVTISFEVVHIDGTTGFLHAKGSNPDWDTYNPKEFTVVSREVPDRLPAGTITRQRSTGDIRLRTQGGWINLSSGQVIDRLNSEAFENDLRDGRTEVIYLP